MTEVIPRRVRGTAAALAALLLGPHAAFAFPSSNDAAVPDQPVFALSQDFPADLETARQGERAPWEAYDFKTTAGARHYLLAVLRYVVEGNERVFDRAEGAPDRPWQTEVRGRTRWFHVPWMHTGTFGRESIHGMTRERALSLHEVLPPEERPPADQDRRFQSWAVGFYNPLGGYTVGRVWPPDEDGVPRPVEAKFPNGTVVAKLLFATATEADISYLRGAPVWRAKIHRVAELFPERLRDPTYEKKGCWLSLPEGMDPAVFEAACEREPQPMRLVQVDIGIKDERATETGWVLGTFVFNGNRPPDAAGAIVPGERLVAGASPWNQLEPVGLMWGNDPGVDAVERIEETLQIGDEGVSTFQHLGCRNRLNGPVDNPAASCLACHALARFPVPDPDNFPMTFAPCGTARSMAYFRNLQGHEPIDDRPGVRGLDYSLQLSFGISNFCDHWEGQTDAEPPEEVTTFCRFDRQVEADHQEALATPRSAVDPKSLVKYLEVDLKRQSR